VAHFNKRGFQLGAPATSTTSMPLNLAADHHSYDSAIGSYEYFWVDHQPFLLSRGYKLRPRYDPKWIPTWKQPGKKDLLPGLCEDGKIILVSILAVRTRTSCIEFFAEQRSLRCHSRKRWC